MRDVMLLLDVKPYGKHALYYAGMDHGDYKKAGFNVRFEGAQGSLDAATKVGAKVADFGLADTSALIVARSDGAMIKELFMTHYKSLVTVISFKKAGIKEPKDLVGKTIAGTVGDTGRVLAPALAKINNFDASKITYLTIEHPQKPATLAADKADAAFDYYTSMPSYEAAGKQVNQEPTALLYADWGLDIYNNGIIAHDDTLKSDPQMVKDFLGALGNGIVWAVENPDAATDIMLKYNPALSKDVAREQLQIHIDFMMVPEVKQHGIGPMETEKMQKTLDITQANFDLKRKVSLDEIWSNNYTPKGLLPKT